MKSASQHWSRQLPGSSEVSLRHQRQQAKQRQQAGHYNPATLWLFRRIWRQSRRAADLLAYLKFRRALGYPLCSRRASQLRQLLASNLLRRWQLGITPGVAADLRRLLQEGGHWPGRQPDWLKRQLNQQPQLQAQWLQRCRQASRIAIVGNGAQLLGRAAGAAIDAADLVIRFNHCFGEPCAQADLGSRTDIWVVAPGFRGPVVPASLVILSGPAMLWQLKKLRYLQHLAAPILQLPLSCWQTQVRRFAAPPSAATLVAQWLLSEGISPAQLQLFGIGEPHEGPYHQALPNHQASLRHHWQAEQHWWQQLIAAGAWR